MTLLQRNDGWFASRVGKMTASQIKDIDAKPQKGKAYNAVTLKILTERLTGVAAETPTTQQMQWGIDNEVHAIGEYEILTEQFVRGCELIDHHAIAMSGASPDGLVGEDGQIEVKCPNTTTHINTLLTREIPNEYVPQITWQLACTRRKWCDFISYDPRMPIGLQIIVIRVFAKDLDISGYEQKVILFNRQVDQAISDIKSVNDWVLGVAA
ncbi:lambda exonuclease family protein [Acinetobacter puyangensis]|uniref:lambda exonuclease family protein n=1 Tax=Acinetobacter puyangensis TaxID=1096779 RepID=UPI003A4DB7AF